MRFLPLAAAAAFALTFATAAPAQTGAVSVPKGQPTVVETPIFGNVAKCRSVRVKWRVASKPKHGTVTFQDTRATRQGGNCADRPARATAIIYTPKPGYTGPDTFAVRARARDSLTRIKGSAGYMRYSVNVR